MMRSLALVLAATAVVEAQIDYSKMMTSIWTKTDADKNGELSFTEFTNAAAKMDMQASIFTLHNQNLQTFFNALDKDGTKGVTAAELAAAITDYPTYKTPLIASFTNGAGAVPTKIPQASPGMTKAKAKVTMSMDVEDEVFNIPKGTRKQMAAYFAAQCGVPVADVIMAFLPKATATGVGRRLQTAGAAKTTISGTAYVADDAAATAALAKLPKDKAGFAAVPAFSDMTIKEVKVDAKRQMSLSFGTAAVVFVILLVLSILVCVFASKKSKAKASEMGADGGCCQAGCCSFYAVKPWGVGEMLVALVLIFCVIFIFMSMSGLAKSITGLIDTLVSLTTSTVPVVKTLTSKLPTSIINTINQFKSFISLLPIAAMVPGLFCVLFMATASLCSMSSKRKGTYCCTKCMIMLGNLFMLISFVFYAIFAGVGAALTMPPPVVQSAIILVTGSCDTIPTMINQLLADNEAALNQMIAAGTPASSLTTIQTQLADVKGVSGIITTGCGHITQMFVDFSALFAPSVCCMIAIFFAAFMNNTLCCAAGCCKSNNAAGQVKPEA